MFQVFTVKASNKSVFDQFLSYEINSYLMLVMLRCSGNGSWFLNVIFKALLPTWWSKTAECIIHGLSYSCLYFWFMVGECLYHFNEMCAHPLLSYSKRSNLINTCSDHYSSSARRLFLRQSSCWQFRCFASASLGHWISLPFGTILLPILLLLLCLQATRKA